MVVVVGGMSVLISHIDVKFIVTFSSLHFARTVLTQMVLYDSETVSNHII